MARTVTADAEDFARFYFRLIEERATDGAWLAARDVIDQAASAYPTHPFVQALAEKPGRRVVFSAAAERVRRSDFAHIERKKWGTRRGAPVFYRLARPMLADTAEAAPEVEPAPTPAPSVPATAVGGLPACMPKAEPVRPSDAGRARLHATLRHLRRLEAGASARDTWWARLLEPLARLVARLHAAVARH